MSNDLVISRSRDDLCFGVIGLNLYMNPAHNVVARLKPTDLPQDNAAAAYVFTNRPLSRGECLTVRIQGLEDQSKAALGFGVTSCDPFTVDVRRLPTDCELLYDRPEYWVIDKASFTDVRLGDELRFFLTESSDGFGEIKYKKNGELEKMLMCVDYTVSLWPFFELGKIREIRMNNSLFSDRPTTGGSTPNIVDGIPNLFGGGRSPLPARPHTAEFTLPKTDLTRQDNSPLSSAEPQPQRRIGLTVRRPAPPPPRMPPSTRPTPPPPPSHPQTQPRVFAPTPFVLASGSTLRRNSQSLDSLSQLSINPRAPPPPVATKPLPPTAKPSLIRPPPVSSTQLPVSRPTPPTTRPVPIPGPREPNTTAQGRSKEGPTSPTSSSSVTSSSVTSSSVTSSSECTICMDTEVNCVLYTCGHMCLCYDCAVALKRTSNGLCPICRQTITDIIKIYKS